MNKKNRSILFALLAALLFGMQAPFSKILLNKIDALFLASLLYLGAGLGMLFVKAIELRLIPDRKELPLGKKDLPFVFLMIGLDIAAPILLLFGLQLSSAGTASLLVNFEVVATSILAMMLFRETVGKRLWISIALITLASLLLSAGNLSDIRWSPGSVLILAACFVWGLENNCTRRLSSKDPLQIVIIKGLGSGTGSLILAIIFGSLSGNAAYIPAALLLGFFAYGLSIFFYVKAQRELGAARTSAFYAGAPFVGVLLSWIVLRETISYTFLLAFVMMLAGSAFLISEKRAYWHIHDHSIHRHSYTADPRHRSTHDHTHTNP